VVDPIINSPGWNKVTKFCANCGTPVIEPTDTCRQCGFWFEAYEHSVIEDPAKAQQIRNEYHKMKRVK